MGPVRNMREISNIDNLVQGVNNNINYDELIAFFDKKIKELYEKERMTNLFDQDNIRYSAMIDVLYEMMPSLKDELKLKESEVIN